ncbi:MAG: peptidylprolyl isomerase [Mariprofundaceae bacterium]|nr:peptidylprolyl isomerase [Mariprofundaceae bacterium]
MPFRTFLCALILVGIAACDKPETTPEAKKETAAAPVVIASVGKTTFTEADIDREFANLPERFQAMKDNDGMRANILNGLMTRKTLTDKAESMDIAKSPSIQSQLAQAKASILIQALHKDYQEKQNNVSEESIQKYFDENKGRFNKGEQVHTRHILVKEEELAKTIAQQLKDGTSFASLASKYSIDPGTKKNGGELPPFGQGAMDPAFEKAAFALTKKDEVSAIVQTRFGFHLIQFIEKIAAQETKLEDVQAQIKNEISQKLFQKWVEDLKSENNFSIASDRYKQHIKVPTKEEPTATPAK